MQHNTTGQHSNKNGQRPVWPARDAAPLVWCMKQAEAPAHRTDLRVNTALSTPNST